MKRLILLRLGQGDAARAWTEVPRRAAPHVQRLRILGRARHESERLGNLKAILLRTAPPYTVRQTHRLTLKKDHNGTIESA